jgi:hypothetical protein
MVVEVDREVWQAFRSRAMARRERMRGEGIREEVGGRRGQTPTFGISVRTICRPMFLVESATPYPRAATDPIPRCGPSRHHLAR